MIYKEQCSDFTLMIFQIMICIPMVQVLCLMESSQGQHNPYLCLSKFHHVIKAHQWPNSVSGKQDLSWDSDIVSSVTPSTIHQPFSKQGG